MTVRRTGRGAIFVLLLVGLTAGSCVSNVPILGASCPCPTGYCCREGACVLGTCADAGTRDAPDAEPDAAPDGDAPAGGPTLVDYGDEIVVRFLSSGRSLVGLAAPVFNTTRGQLVVHHLDASTRENSGSVEALDGIKTAARADALLSRRQLWTPKLGFAAVPYPVALSDDGRFMASLDPVFADQNSLVVDIFSTTVASTDNGMFVGVPLRTISPVATNPYVVFSADGATVFVADQSDGPFTLKRLSTSGDGAAQVYVKGTDGLDQVPFLINAAGDVAFRDGGAIYVWRASDPAPMLGAKPGGLPEPYGPLVGMTADYLYFVVGTDPTAITPTNRLRIGTAQISPFATTAVALKAVSPDGRAAVVQAVAPFGPVTLMQLLPTVREIVTLEPCSNFDRGAFVFTADSRHVVGAPFVCDAPGKPPSDVSPDIVSVDVDTGANHTLAVKSYGDQLFVTDTNRVVFVKPYSPELVSRGDPTMARGDLFMVGLDGGSVTQLVAGVDGAIAGHGHTIAYSVHGPSDRAGVYTIDVP